MTLARAGPSHRRAPEAEGERLAVGFRSIEYVRPGPRAMVVLPLAILGLALVPPAGPPASGAQIAGNTAPPGRSKPGPLRNLYRGSVLYTGRGKGIKKVSFRLKGHKLIEASIVVIESCTTRGGGQGRRYRWRAELEEASRRWPLRVDRRGRFRAFRSEVGPSSDEFFKFVGTVTPRSIVGGISRNSNESAPESGIFYHCHTGPFGGPMKELTFHAWRR